MVVAVVVAVVVMEFVAAVVVVVVAAVVVVGAVGLVRNLILETMVMVVGGCVNHYPDQSQVPFGPYPAHHIGYNSSPTVIGFRQYQGFGLGLAYRIAKKEIVVSVMMSDHYAVVPDHVVRVVVDGAGLWSMGIGPGARMNVVEWVV